MRAVLSRTLLVLSLVACSKGDAPADTAAAAAATATADAAPPSSGDDLADITSYTLTMAGIEKSLDVQRHLGMKVKAMSAEERQAFEDADIGGDPDEGIDDMARKIAAQPVMAAAVRDAGLTPREYALLIMSMVQSGMAGAVVKLRPEANQDSLAREMKANPANVRFMIEHEAEIKQKQAALEAELRAAGVPMDN